MTTIRNRLFMLIHGPYGTGKTTLANTAPGPRLILDAEGGSYDVDKTIIVWDPDEPLPEIEDKDTSVIVDCQDWATYRKVLDLLVSGDHPFLTVVFDSLTEIQKQLKDALNPDQDFGSYTKPDWDIWDQLLVFMEKDVRKLRDLTRPSSRKPINVVVVAASNMDEHPHRPILQGAIKRSLPGFVDLEAYLHVEHIIDERSGKAQERRVIDISPHDDSVAEVKCRPRLLKEKHGSEMWDPDIKRILRTTYPKRSTAATEKASE